MARLTLLWLAVSSPRVPLEEMVAGPVRVWRMAQDRAQGRDGARTVWREDRLKICVKVNVPGLR